MGLAETAETVRPDKTDCCNRKVIHVIPRGGRNGFSYNGDRQHACFTEDMLLVTTALRSVAPATFEVAVFREKPTAHDFGTFVVDDDGSARVTGFRVLFETEKSSSQGLPIGAFMSYDRIEIELPEHFT